VAFHRHYLDAVIAGDTLSIEGDKYLTMLDPSMGHDEWLRVLMAINHETDGSDEGFNIFDEWSSSGVQYPGTAALRARWDSLGKRPSGRPITARWLIKMANQEKAGDAPILDCNDFMGIARKFIDANFTKEDGISLLKANGLWYGNVGSHYSVRQDDVIKSQAYKWLEKSVKHGKDSKGMPSVVPFKPNRTKVDGVMEALRAVSIIEDAAAPRWLDGRTHPEPSEIVSMANGLLHIPTRQLMPHSVNYFNVNSLPYDWVDGGVPILAPFTPLLPSTNTHKTLAFTGFY
jgi:hypothetical protein